MFGRSRRSSYRSWVRFRSGAIVGPERETCLLTARLAVLFFPRVMLLVSGAIDNKNHRNTIGLIPYFQKNFRATLKTRVKIHRSRPICWLFVGISGERSRRL